MSDNEAPPPNPPKPSLHPVKRIFLNNKGSRAAAIEHEFTNLTLRSMNSPEDYCQKLKDLVYQLSDVETQSMLQLERNRQQTREQIAAPIVGLTASDVHIASDSSSKQPRQSRGGPPTRHPNRGGPPLQRRDRQPQGSSSQTRHSRPNTPNQSSFPTYHGVPPWWNMMPPPCPYPTQQGWAYPWYSNPRPTSQPPSRRTSNTPTQFPAHTATAFNALEPTDIGAVFQAATLDPLSDFD
ncbi:hypothetical protein LXL04_011436 [Taraxacum kok-saghyz]